VRVFSLSRPTSKANKPYYIFIYGLPSCTDFFFAKLYHKRQDFWEKEITENKIHVLIFSKLLSKIFLILRITDLDILINTEMPSCKVPVILVKF